MRPIKYIYPSFGSNGEIVSVRTMAERWGFSKRKARRIMRKYEEAGLIVRSIKHYLDERATWTDGKR